MARDIYNRYLKSCEKRKLEPIPSVLEACRNESSTLTLAGCCISVDTCSMLAKTLQRGHPFTELDFSDCLMGNEGLTKLVEFLRDDTQITSVILKGNSIKSSGTLAIADLLKRNSSIQRLSLEWNGVGLYEGGVKILCEALSVNTCLCVLDLRSNHIDHAGASHLASTLLLNATIQELDLRWNNLGVLGGRKLLSAIRSNSGLVRLRLEGNNVPSDITDAIETTLSLRLSHHVAETQHHMEALQLSAQLNELQTHGKQRVMEMLDTLDSERAAFLQTTQLSQCEVADLKCHLEERDTTIARLETKLLEVQSVLRESLAKSSELCGDLEEVRTQASSEDMAKQSRIEELEKDVISMEERRSKILAESSDKEREADTKVNSLEQELQVLKGKLAASSRDQDSNRENLTARITLLGAQLREKEGNFKEQISQLNQVHQRELFLSVDEGKNKETVSARKLQESRDQVARLEKELRSVRVSSGSDKGKAMEETERFQQALKIQSMKSTHLEDQMEELKSSHRSMVENLRSTLSQQQSEKGRLEQECSKLQQKIKTLHQELESERCEWDKDRDSHRRSLKEQAGEKEVFVREIKLLKKSLEDEQKHIFEMESTRERDVKALQNERGGLKQKLEQQRAVIQRFQVDEQQRMSQLKAALNTYFTTTPKLTETDMM